MSDILNLMAYQRCFNESCIYLSIFNIRIFMTKFFCIAAVLLIYSNNLQSAAKLPPALLKEAILNRAEAFAQQRANPSSMIHHWRLAYRAYAFTELIQHPNKDLQEVLSRGNQIESSNSWNGEQLPFKVMQWDDELIYPHFQEACQNSTLKNEKVERDWLAICAQLSAEAGSTTKVDEEPVLPLQFLLSMCNTPGDMVEAGNVVYKNVGGVITTHGKSNEIIVIEANGTKKSFTPAQFEEKYGVKFPSRSPKRKR
jgi:hypothetical protein